MPAPHLSDIIQHISWSLIGEIIEEAVCVYVCVWHLVILLL